MLADLKKISKDLIIFSVLASDFEKLDFKNDALAGVRANYFNSGMKEQKDRTSLSFDGREFLLSYSLKKDEPISWKISSENKPFQSVNRFPSGVYCVITYSRDGIAVKRQFFDCEHSWLRTEYSDGASSAVISRLELNGVAVLKYEGEKEGKSALSYLFPSRKAPKSSCAALAYTNLGMLWFDECFKPENFEFPEGLLEADSGVFGFKPEDFGDITSKRAAIDLNHADFLRESDIKPLTLEAPDEREPEEEKPYSAYDRIEDILFEASKSNKDLFGEIISQYDGEEELELVDENRQEEIREVAEGETGAEEPEPDSVIKNKSGKYKYYGKLDANNLRTGRGRTVTPDGLTSYDGEYFCGKRNGFGVCYYNEGKVNYIGNWEMGSRSGSGVGYRLSDGTMHAGKWSDNAPTDYGARFDSDGDFIDVCRYSDGMRNGKSVSFDEEGSLVVRLWVNGELSSEKILSDGDIFDDE